MILHRRALVLALAGLASISTVLAQTPPETMQITYTDANGAVVSTQDLPRNECVFLEEPGAAAHVSAAAANLQAGFNLYSAPYCSSQLASVVGTWSLDGLAAAVGVSVRPVSIRYEGPAPSQYTTGYVNATSVWPPNMVYQKTRTELLFQVDPEKGLKVVIVVSIVLAIGVSIGLWKVYKAATYVKPPELMKKKKEPKDREYTGVVGNKKVKKKHAYYRKPVRDAHGNLVAPGGFDDKRQERYRDEEEEEEERFDEYGRRLIKDENGEWQVEDRDSSDDTDSEVEERRKKAEKRRRRAQQGRRRGSEDSDSSRDHDASSSAAHRALNNSSNKSSGAAPSGPGFLKLGGKRSSAGSSTLASHHQHSPMTTTTFRQNQYTGVSGRASPQPVLIDMQETNYQQRRPLGAPSPAPSSSSAMPGGNAFSQPSVSPQPSTVTTYNLPAPAHTQIDLMRFDNSSPSPSSGRNNHNGYDPHQNPYQQRQQQSNEVVVSMPQQYQNHHHPTSPTRRGGYSTNQRF